MSILVRYTPASGATTEKYDESIRRLEQSGEFPPDGLEYHVAFFADGDLRVSEIWDSKQQLEAFSQRLMPLLGELDIQLASEPEVLEVHNTIRR